ncbi:MAG: tryptophan synthase subunit alpha [Betaproteobacteria bacterium]|jgi:tryptophan synthase alpha chain
MNRIQTTFQHLLAHQQTALIPYIMCGYPSPQITVELMHTLVKSGANIIELGVPFSDPMADGPVIQKAGEHALSFGVGMIEVLACVKAFRQSDSTTPVVLMGYANPIESYDHQHGAWAFIDHAHRAGVDGVLVVDYPPEECAEFAKRLKDKDMDLIFLLAPTSTPERMQLVSKVASGYVYYVSLKGITGAGHLDTQAVERMLPQIRQHVHIPVGVGFGIRDKHSAKALSKVADAVVIGTKLIELLQAGSEADKLSGVSAFISEIREALDAH